VKRNSKSLLSGKGFYIALTLSVAMVGTACYFAYSQSNEDYTAEVESGFGVAETTEIEPEENVAKLQTDVTKRVTLAESSTVISTEATDTSVSETVVSELTDDIADENVSVGQVARQEDFTLSMPLEGEVIGEFSKGELIKSPTTGAWQTHNGIDIKAAEGDSVTAAASGKVSEVEDNPLWGVTVSVDHGNGIITRYCSLNSGVAVQVGQEISAGEEIGSVGKTADIESKQDTHLHFEVVRNGSYTDPMDYM